MRIEAFEALSDKTATFAYRWRAAGAAERWADAGELSWQLVGRGWDVPMRRVRAVVSLPAGATAKQVRAWGHGPLNGVVRRRADGSVTFAIDDLAPNTFVEAHLLFPARLLADAQTTEIKILPSRLATEAELARRANEQRALARAEVAAEHRGRVIAWTVSGGVTAAALVVWFVLFFSGGREYRPRSRVKYLREVPEGLPPALVGALWRMGAVTDADIAATLLDLAVDGVLRIEPGGGEAAPAGGGTSGPAAAPGPAPTFALTLRRDKLAEVDALTLPLVTFLFDHVSKDDTLTMAQLKGWAEGHPARFRKGIEGWRSAVQQRARELGFVEKGGGRRMLFAVLAAGPRRSCDLGRVRRGPRLVAARAHRRLHRVRARQPGDEAALARGGPALRAVSGAVPLPARLRPAAREAAGRCGALGALSRDGRRVRHRSAGDRADADPRPGSGR